MAGRPVNIALTGIKELDAKLLKMQTNTGQRVARTTLLTGARVVQKEIRKLATKFVKPTIGVRVEKSRKSARIEGKVGVNVGKGKQADAKTRWAPLTVLGSVSRFRKRIGGKFSYITKPTQQQLSTGQITKSNVVNRGYSAAKGKMNSAMKRAFDRAVKRESAKAKLK